MPYIFDKSNEKRLQERLNKHLLDHNLGRAEVKREGIVKGSWDMIRRFGQRLICPKCERAMYYDYKEHDTKKLGRCPHCGYHGESITLDEYLKEKMDRT